MKRFPEFITTEVNRVAETPDPGITGTVFDGADGSQVVFWECEEGGTQPEQVHDFWEYALVVEGTFDGEVGGAPGARGRVHDTPRRSPQREVQLRLPRHRRLQREAGRAREMKRLLLSVLLTALAVYAHAAEKRFLEPFSTGQ